MLLPVSCQRHLSLTIKIPVNRLCYQAVNRYYIMLVAAMGPFICGPAGEPAL